MRQLNKTENKRPWGLEGDIKIATLARQMDESHLGFFCVKMAVV